MDYRSDCRNCNLLGESIHASVVSPVVLLAGLLDLMTLEDFSNLNDSIIPFIILCAAGILNILLPPEIT